MKFYVLLFFVLPGRLVSYDSIEIIEVKIGSEYKNATFRKQELERWKTDSPSDLFY